MATEYTEKLRSLAVIGRRTRDQVKTWRTDDGERHQATRDELGNVVTQHARPNNTEDRQDVLVQAQTVRLERSKP